MGWASGSEVLESVLEAVYKHIPEDKRKQVLARLIDVFEMHDCDTVPECFSSKWPELEKAWKKKWPEDE